MTLKRLPVGILLGAALLVAGDGPRAQAPAAPQKFEVASVRQNTAGDMRMSFGVQPGGRFTVTNIPLLGLIRQAYGVQPNQIVGGPDWIETTRYDIVAKAEGELPRIAPGGPPGPLNLMMQDLLADRFKLRVRRETRELPIYVLTFARDDRKLGQGLRASSLECSAMRGRGGRGGRGGVPPGPPAPGERVCGMRMAPGNVMAGGVQIQALTQLLSNFAGRMVVDKTGLEGSFDIDLTFTPDRMPQGGLPPGAPSLPPIDPNGPSLFTALQEQLGLKLDSQRGPVDVLVIDHVERPEPD